MIYSMTGYGKGEALNRNKRVSVDIKSVNGKNADISVRMPIAFREIEMDIRALVAKKLARGKIDIIITVDSEESDRTTSINKSIVKAYFYTLKDIADELKVETDFLQIVMRLPDVIKSEYPTIDDEDKNLIFTAVEKAIEKLTAFREQEGKAMEDDFRIRIEKILQYLDKIRQYDPQRIEKIKEKLSNSLENYLKNIPVDKERFEQEIIYYLEKFDITEEKVRLKNHCEYFEDTLSKGGKIGKKLGFIAQEIGREINTIGSKANHAGIQKIVVLMKDELEKIKEQVLNVL